MRDLVFEWIIGGNSFPGKGVLVRRARHVKARCSWQNTETTLEEKVNPTGTGHLSSEVLLKTETTTSSGRFLVEAGLRQIQAFFHFTWQGNSQLVLQHGAEPDCKTAAFPQNGNSQFWLEQTNPFLRTLQCNRQREAETGALLA